MYTADVGGSRYNYAAFSEEIIPRAASVRELLGAGGRWGEKLEWFFIRLETQSSRSFDSTLSRRCVAESHGEDLTMRWFLLSRRSFGCYNSSRVNFYAIQRSSRLPHQTARNCFLPYATSRAKYRSSRVSYSHPIGVERKKRHSKCEVAGAIKQRCVISATHPTADFAGLQK